MRSRLITRRCTKNLRRDPRASLLVMDDALRESVQVDGTTEIVSLPDAMEPLVLRISVERAGPDSWG